MPADAFLDTHILICQLDTSDPRKSTIADRLVTDALRTGNACISYQVVQECLQVVTTKARVRLAADDAHAYLDAVLLPLMKVGASAELYKRALGLKVRWQLGFYDALVVAGALAAGCTRLLSEDLQHGQRIETLTVSNPFLMPDVPDPDRSRRIGLAKGRFEVPAPPEGDDKLL
jgi:predicted nucleic acid-binding protein